MKLSPRNMLLTAMFTTITAVLAQISIPLPFSPVPFAMQILGVFLAGGILGYKLGALSQIIYLLLGAVGAPIFAQMLGGIGVIVGPTGGYLIAYPFAAALVGYTMEKYQHFKGAFWGMFLGLWLVYTVGLIQLKIVTGLSWQAAFLSGVAPFIIFDLIKVLIAVMSSVTIINALKRNNLLPHQNPKTL